MRQWSYAGQRTNLFTGGPCQVSWQEGAEKSRVGVAIDGPGIMGGAGKVSAAVVGNVEMHLLSHAYSHCRQENQQSGSRGIGQNQFAFREVWIRSQRLDANDHERLMEIGSAGIVGQAFAVRHGWGHHVALGAMGRVVVRE